MKVLIHTTLPSPYRMKFFQELGKICDLTVTFEEHRPSNGRVYNWFNESRLTFKAIFFNEIRKNHKINFAALKFFMSNRFDIKLITCYHTYTSMFLTTCMKLFHKKYLLEIDGAMISISESKIKRMAKKFFLSGAVCYISPSKLTDNYFKYYISNKINIERYSFTSVGNNDVIKKPLSEKEKLVLKQELGLSSNFLILSVGQFIYRKGFDVLIKSMKNIIFPNVTLLLIGGKESDEYKEIREKNNIKNVLYMDFMDTETLKKYYLASDVFVLPTREDIWGLVINEAMSCALPIVSTSKCVAACELLDKDLIVDTDNVTHLAEKINKLISDVNYRNEIANRNLKIIASHTYEKMALEHINIFLKYKN